MKVEQLTYPDEFFPYLHQSYIPNTNKVTLFTHHVSFKCTPKSVGVWKPKSTLNQKS